MLLALACGLAVLALPAGAAPSATDTVAITVDESVSSGDASNAAGPAGVASDEPIGTADAVIVAPPADVPGTEGVTIGDAVTVVPPATVASDETVHVGDTPSVVPPASAAAAETARVTDEVSVVPTASATTTAVTATPDPALFGTAVQLEATVTSGGAAVGSGAVTFEDGATPLAAPVPVDASGRASLTVSTLSLGSHLIAAGYGGSASFLASSAMTSEGIYDYALSAGPDRTVLRGDPAAYTLTLSLDPGSATTGLPSSVPLSVGLLPADASSDAPATVAFPQAPDAPTSQAVTVHTGVVTLGDVSLSFAAGARSAGAGLHVYDYALALAPATETVQRGDTASFTLTSALGVGSTAIGLPSSIALTASPGATAGPLALPGSTPVAVATGASTPAGAQTVTVTGDPGARSASATLYVNVPPVVSAGGPYSGNEGSTLALHGSAVDTPGETLTYSWDLGGGATASGATPSIVLGDGPGTQTVTLTACDDHGACASDVATITIANVAPAVRILSPSDGSVFRTGTHVSLSGSFTDPGLLDTHTGAWKVGATTLSATIAEHAGSGSARATWTPATAGFYPLSLTITDKDGGTTTVAGSTLVVVDPNAGSVTGLGTLLDPSRSLVAFAFSARYRDHDRDGRLDGAVELHVPHLNLSSTHLDWLVVTAPSFELQGAARGDGRRGYRFLLTGVTGRPDQLRVQIWSPGGALVYDSTLRPLRAGDIAIRR